MTMAVNDVVQVTAFFRDGQSAAQVVRHYRLTAVTEDDDLTAMSSLMTFLGTHWTNVIEVNSTASAGMVCLTAQKVMTGASRIFSAFFGAANGQVLGEANAAQLAVLVSLYTASTEAYGRGRMYIPFPAEANSEGGVILNTVADDLLLAVGPMLIDFTDSADNEWSPVVYGRSVEQANRITDYVLRPVLATQRRRRVGLQPFAT